MARRCKPASAASPKPCCSCLGDKRDLGIHTEMCPDGVIDLMEAGVINGARKSLHRGKAVAAFVLGTQTTLRLHPRESELRVPIDLLHQRSVCRGAERSHGCHQFRVAGGSDRAGLRRFARAPNPTADSAANWISFAAQRAPGEECQSSHCPRPPAVAQFLALCRF